MSGKKIEKKTRYNIRLNPGQLEALEEIARYERKRTGDMVTVSDLVRHQIDKLIEKYERKL